MSRSTLERLEDRIHLSTVAKPAVKKSAKTATSSLVVQQPSGALSGKIVYTSGGHGYTADATATGTWLTGRPLSNGIVEDFGNQDQMSQFVYYAFNAGATVVPMRPVGNQPNEVILDNTSSGVTFSGAWSAGGTSAGTHYFYANTATPAARYMFSAAGATETAVARYTPTIPAAGVYPVYAWASFDTDRLIDQTYRITYNGGVEEVKVNHRMVGNGWVYLGSYSFAAGASDYVEISNKSGSSGNAIADAIRFGNGMGDIVRGGTTSGHTREDEGSLYWVQKQAQNTYVASGSGGASLIAASTYNGSLTQDSQANVAAPIRWAVFMNNEWVGAATDRVYLSFHSNASGAEGGSRGTLGLYNGNNRPSTKTPHQPDLALDVAKEINDDLVSIDSKLEYDWFNKTAASDLILDRTDIEFGEINNDVIGGEFDATIAEVGFHDNTQDAADLLDPKVRAQIGQASTQGIIRYFNTFSNVATNFAPSAPINPRALTGANGDITVSWTAPAATAAAGDAATSYLLQSSTDGKGFDGGIAFAGTTYTFPAASLGSGAQFFRLLAVNAGGVSTPSVVVAARKNPYGKSTILVVNGFDRIDRAEDPTQTTRLTTTDATTLVTAVRVRPTQSNSFDYVAQAGLAIAAYSTPLGFDSVQHSDIAAGKVNLNSYDTVIWLDGEESAADLTFTSAEQSAVTAYVNSGGHFFVSGSEIGYDLVANAHGSTFYTGTLHAGYAGDDANTYNVSGAAGSIFAGLSFAFDNGSQFYDVDFPDRLTASGGSSVSLNYVGGTADGAAVQYSGSNGSKVVNFGFPFETINTATARATVMSAVLNYFGVGTAASTPVALALSTSSDTGSSNSDGVTRLNNSLQFSVNGTTPGATVSLFADGAFIGSAVASGSVTTVTANSGITLADGTRSITASQSVSGRPTSTAVATSIVIDTVAPTLTKSNFVYDFAQALQLTTSESVAESLNNSDFLINNLTTAQTTSAFALSVAGTTATLQFTGTGRAPLDDGNYRTTLISSGITDLAGNALAQSSAIDFFVLSGDFNRDHKVDVIDLGILSSHWQMSGTGFSLGDSNYDGKVDVIDLGQISSNWQKSLLPPAPSQIVVAKIASTRKKTA